MGDFANKGFSSLFGGGGGGGDPVSGLGSGSGPGMNAMKAEGGQVKTVLSPGERVLKPGQVKGVAEGKKNAMKEAEKVPGKPKVGGAVNSYANDTVPRDLAAGSIVLPRSVTQSEDPAAEAHKFVSAIMARKRLK